MRREGVVWRKDQEGVDMGSLQTQIFRHEGKQRNRLRIKK